MITVTVRLRTTREPLKRLPVALLFDASRALVGPVWTDRAGQARFDVVAGSGKVLVDGLERYHGHLGGEIPVELWSILQAPEDSGGAPGGAIGDSVAYPDMQLGTLPVNGRPVQVDAEGYLVRPQDWSEEFARAEAAREGLELGDEHWEVIRWLRAHFAGHGVQAAVRDMVRHFRQDWGPERGSSSHLHGLFPNGGPQKQGNRLAGLLRTKGEH
jgi:tRNA 2-thiouridine synthesizing protein E